MRAPLYLLVLFAATGWSFGQIATEPVEGLRKNTPRLHVLRGATVWVDPETRIEEGIVVLRDGFIEVVGGPETETPDGAREWELNGRVLYPGFVEAAAAPGKAVPVGETNTHWNDRVRPERRTAEYKPPSEKTVKELRNLGFAAAHLIPEEGIVRGRSCVVNLGASPSVLNPDVYQCLALETTEKEYPVSLMGTMALLRQVFHDAGWYGEMETYLRKNPGVERPESNTALSVLTPVIRKSQSLFARADDELDYARYLSLAAEFDLPNPVILGNGYEYRQARLLEDSKTTVVVPLRFPDPPAVENPGAALNVSLERLEHWELAPGNAAALVSRKIPVCLTSYELEKPDKSFWKNVRTAVKRGLPRSSALEALTRQPSVMLGLSDRLGSLEPGKIANLVVSRGDLFTEKNAEVHIVWVDGQPYETEAAGRIDLRGTWKLTWGGVDAPGEWEVKGTESAPELKIGDDDFSLRREEDEVLIFPEAEFFGEERGKARLVGYVDRETATVRGTGALPGGNPISWTAKITEGSTESDDDEDGADDPAPAAFTTYPAGAFGMTELPSQPESILVRNATIWTSSEAGKLENTDLLIEKGIITRMGQDIDTESAEHVIDGEGKHVTAGLIDCHSHSAISRGINEWTHAVTVEVKIGDVIDPTDIALYRELAGGLTTANILHGSANPMGGQNQVIKLRWGARRGEDLQFQGAKPGVKFALGENVKQSNWDEPTDRYPQTRMGVEQIMKDTFLAARDYEKARAKADAEGRPHRRNLRLETALEILNGERIVHIHSYRQDEILMFVRLAQELGFTVGTFQHVLEGYKVADAIAEIGAGGSSFSDWWAYKFEVYDAIPYNGAVMHRAGVLTSFNSDSNELATRLNTEAAKAVKYGGLSEEEALRFVTINPARQLRIDDRVGSLEPGKDADFVIWSGPPLSSFSRAEETWIEGRKFFDLEMDRLLREAALSERERLIAKALPRRLTSLTEKKEQAKENEKMAKPGARWFLQRDWKRRCRHGGRGLYHNGLDAFTCSGACCGTR